MTGEEASCQGKKVFRTYWEAARSAKKLARYREKSKPNPYRCASCGKFHVGNHMGNKRRREEK